MKKAGETVWNKYRPTVFALATCSFFVGLDSLIVVPLLPDIIADVGLNSEDGVLLVSVYALAYMISAPVFGVLSDRIGRRFLVVAGFILLGLGTAATGLMMTLGGLLLVRSATGVAAGIVEPNVLAMVGDQFDSDLRGQVMGLVIAAMILSTIVGVPLGGFLADTVGWHWTFYTAGGLALILVLFVRQYLPARNIRSPNDAVKLSEEFSDVLSVMTRRGPVRTSLLTTLFWYAGLQGLFANIGIFYNSVYDLNVRSIALLIMLAGAGSVAGSVIGGRMIARLQRGILFLASAVTVVAALVSLALAHGLLLTIVLHIVWATAFGFGQAVLSTTLSEIEPESRGVIMSLNSSAMFAGMMVATAASAFLLRMGGFNAVIAMCVMAVLASVIFWRHLYNIVSGAPSGQRHEARLEHCECG